MSLSDTRMNMIMKKLTSWAAIIAVPTAVTGYFGQNVPYPGFNQTWGFYVSIVAMIVIALALYMSRSASATGSDRLAGRAQPARLGSTPVNRAAAASRSSGTMP